MRRSERVVFALGAAGEAAEAAALAKSADAVAPPGHDLVRIGLVADVPDQLVAGRVEHIMERDRQLDYAQPSAQMPAGHRHRGNHFLTKFVGKLGQLFFVQRPQVGGIVDGVQQWGFGTI